MAPDGELLQLDHLDGSLGSPRVLILHGLEGSSRSVYVQGLLLGLRARGWSATVLNFRSCAWDGPSPRRVPVQRPRLYHSGETGDLAHVAHALASRDRKAPLFAIGISLGGNVLLKWLGETGRDGPVRAAAAISVPFDLAAGARHLEEGAGRLYVAIFLRSLREKTIDILRRFPDAQRLLDIEAVRKASSFQEFDDAATAPLHGFQGAADYYRRSSSLAFLPRVAVPTLCLNAADDPFLPPEVLEKARAAASEPLRVVVTSRGGHVGFVGSAEGRLRYWAEEAALAWLDRQGRCAILPREACA